MSDPKLDKIRGLLAKAESSEFPEEAQAFSEKAQELMARYAIDQAMIEASDPGAKTKPLVVQIRIQQPYVNSKQALLSAVAKANRCRIVYESNTQKRVVHVFGFESDVQWVQELFVSLLLQSTREMLKTKPEGNTKSFRNNFLYGYAASVRRRLLDANRREQDERPTTSSNVALVLANRKSEVDNLVDDTFGKLGRGTYSGPSAAGGYQQGRSAGNNASLHRGVSSQRGLPK